MKIVCVNNFDRENVSDRLICENINEYNGERIVNFLNCKEGPNSMDYYKLVKDDYKLYVFEP